MADNLDAQSLIIALKEMAITLGRTPTRDEFAKTIRDGRGLIDKHFGSYTVMVLSAGLDTPRSKKINNDIFKVDIEKHIEVYHPIVEKPEFLLGSYPDAAVISDIHYPFVNRKVEARFEEYVGDVKPTWVLLNGDAWDMYSHTKFPRSHNEFTPREEQNLARRMNEEFWNRIRKSSPDSKCVQLLGNHDVRPMKRIMEEYPEAEDWIAEKLKQLFTYDGVRTIYDPREELFISDSTIVFHGYRSKLGDHRDYTLFNCINGHTHLGGTVFRKIRGQVIWELNSGLAGDPAGKGLTYTPQKITHWTPGFGAVDKNGPRFIHC